MRVQVGMWPEENHPRSRIADGGQHRNPNIAPNGPIDEYQVGAGPDRWRRIGTRYGRTGLKTTRREATFWFHEAPHSGIQRRSSVALLPLTESPVDPAKNHLGSRHERDGARQLPRLNRYSGC